MHSHRAIPVDDALVAVRELFHVAYWTLSANQIEFANLVVDHLTEHGIVNPARLYESPFTDLSPKGPDGLFSSAQLDRLMAVLEDVKKTAQVAA